MSNGVQEHDIVTVRRGGAFAVCEYAEGLLQEIESPRPREDAEQLARQIAEENGCDAWILELPDLARLIS